MRENYAASTLGTTAQGTHREQAQALYELALEDVGWTPHGAMRRLGWPELALEDSIRLLNRLGLFAESGSTPSGWIALPPQNALGDLLGEAKTRVADFCADMTAAWDSAFDTLTVFKTSYMSHMDRSRVMVVEDPADIEATLEREIHGAASEVTLLGSGKLLANSLKPVCASTLDRGIMLRCVVRSSTAGVPQPVNIVRELLGKGAEFRTYPTLPLSFALIDRSTALFGAPPHPLADGAHHRRMIVMQSPLVNEVLRSVFDHYWYQSSPFITEISKGAGDKGAADQERKPVVMHAPTSIRQTSQPDNVQQATLLRMLAGGMTDQAISRRLGVHERTVRRKVAEITASLQASSRFQAGVNAAKAGWLDDEVFELPPEGSRTA
ncbi:LuxR C-terminal-related transcriptional regulator [Streptomyces sp. NPDC059850]|uniref:helix-turn-helix transcriptional regulator n=1 Tax=Streptomyces sp. NPDC059850 TaxID=3346970 RepID=UPI0036545631